MEKQGFKTRKELAESFNLHPDTFDQKIAPINDKLKKQKPKRLYSPAECQLISNFFNSLEKDSTDLNPELI